MNKVQLRARPPLECFPTQNSPHHKRPEEALEPLVEFGGVREEQEERPQEFQQRDRHKSGRGGRREADERHKRQDLRGRGEGFSQEEGETASSPAEVSFLCPRAAIGTELQLRAHIL